MGFEIEVKTGEMGPLWLRGCSDGCVEMCKKGIIKTKDQPDKEGLIAFKYYASVEQAFDRVFRMRLASSEAKTLKELIFNIKAIRAEIKQEMGMLL